MKKNEGEARSGLSREEIEVLEEGEYVPSAEVLKEIYESSAWKTDMFLKQSLGV